MIRYNQISKGDLKKYVGCKCRFETDRGNIGEGIIYMVNDEVGVASNDRCLNGGGYKIKGYQYSWCLYANYEKDNVTYNYAYNRIEIEERCDDLSEMAKNVSHLGDYINELNDLKDNKKYVVYVAGMSAPRKIHETLIEAQNEAKRLCGIEAKDVYVAELVDKYGIEIVKKDF